MELRIYFHMLQKGWWIIALTALVAMNVALGFAYFEIPIYRATATYVVSPNPSQLSANDMMRSLDTLDKRSVVSTYVEFLNSNRVYQETLDQLKLTRDDVRGYTYSSVVLPEANILQLSVEGPNPNMAALLANSLGSNATTAIRQIYQVYDISPLDAAAAPSVPISPQPLRDASLALVLGALIGGTLVIMREQILIPLETYRQQKLIDRTSMAFTRRYFNNLIEGEINRGEDGTFSIGLVKLNGLRDLMDVLPSSMMNKLLSQVNKTLRKELRGNDSVGRWDENSFAILLPSTSAAAASRTMQRISYALDRSIILEPNGEAFDLVPITTTVTSQPGESLREISERLETSLEKSAVGAAISSETLPAVQ